jgi:hypothetical protein
MTLAELIRNLDDYGDDLSIFATPRWRPESRAAAISDTDDGSVPMEGRGMTFMTTVRQAKRVLAARAAERPDRVLSDADRCAAVIYYAIYDETEPLASLVSDVIALPNLRAAG